MAEPAAISGQASIGTEGSTVTAPVEQPGKSVDSSQTSITAPVAEDSFFDPKSIEGKPELQAAYKQMQSAWTKKMQSVSSNKHKLEAYDRFEKDPVGTLKAYAKQLGIEIPEQQQQKFEPQTWDDVTERSKQEAKAEVLKELQPYLNEVKTIKRQAIEKQLSDIDPQWQLYEDQMAATLEAHPTLVSDPAKLYHLSVPPEVIEQRAYKKALEALNGKKETTPSGGSSTPKTPSTKPSGPLTWEQSIAAAHAELAARGIRPG
jgi:hypothetical protein